MLVMIYESQHTFGSVVFEFVGNPGKCFLVERNIVFLVRQYRIISPDHPFPADFISQLLKGIHSFIDGGQMIFQLFSVGVKCKLEVIVVILQFLQLVEHRCRVLGQKTKQSTTAGDRDLANHFRMIWIGH